MPAEPTVACLLWEQLPGGSCPGPNGTALLQQQHAGLVYEHSGHHQEGSDSPSTLSWQKYRGQLSDGSSVYLKLLAVLSFPQSVAPFPDHGLEVSQLAHKETGLRGLV